jgi:hypothetical protein
MGADKKCYSLALKANAKITRVYLRPSVAHFQRRTIGGRGRGAGFCEGFVEPPM